MTKITKITKLKINKNFIIEEFNRLKIFDISIDKLRSKNFYNQMISNRNIYYKKYNKYLVLKKTKCKVCKNNKSKFFASYRNYILRECLNCGTIYNNLNLQKFKTSGFFDNNEAKINDFKLEMIKTFSYRKKAFGKERLEYIKDKIFNKKKSFKVLDYGCGSGYFLSVLKDNNIEARGIDEDINVVNFCKSIKLDVKKASLKDEKNYEYDLITMFDSIEHLYDPVSDLKIAAKKLKPKSYILAFTPNIHSLAFELMRTNHNMLAVFDHICFFNEKSLKFICKKVGLKVKSIEYFGLDIKDYIQYIETIKKIKLKKTMSKFANLAQSIIDKQKLSNSMRIIFQKI